MPRTSADSSGQDYKLVTPSDTVDFDTRQCRYLWIGGAGNVYIPDRANTAVPFLGAGAGSYLYVRCKRVNATLTTATSIVAVF